MQLPPPLTGNDLWQALQEEPRDIWVYGMGNGADKLFAVCAARGIPLCGVFASDGFARGQSFRGMRVMSYSEVKALYPPDGCVVLLAFGTSRPDVIALIDEVAARYPLFVPDLPVCGDNLFDASFYTAHKTEFDAARALFEDEDSRLLFDRVLACKYHARHALFKEAVSKLEAWDILLSHPMESMADLGAYTGDSAREALSKKPLSYILAAEPDPRNFKKLSAFALTLPHGKLDCRAVAVCEKRGEATFDSSGNRNAGLCTGRGSVTVQTDTLDAMLNGRGVDYIKYDVEGAESAALAGSAHTITRHRPALRVALYHRSEDLFHLPLTLHSLCADYRFFLTRAKGFPTWDLDLIAIPE